MAKFILSAFADEAADNLNDQITALQQEQIHWVELRGVNGKNCAQLTLEEADQICKQLHLGGIEVFALGSPYGKIPINKPFAPHLELFRHGLAICKRLQCHRIRMFSFYIPAGDTPQAWRSEVLARLSAMLDEAEAAGIQLVHENEKDIYGDTDDRCLDILNALGGRLGFAFDPANFIQSSVWPEQAFEKQHDRITYMHIKDALMEDGAVVRAGYGDGHVSELLRRLNLERESEIILSVEPHLMVFNGLKALQEELPKNHEAYTDQRSAFHAACKALKNLLEEVG